jgi:hypothetical protein
MERNQKPFKKRMPEGSGRINKAESSDSGMACDSKPACTSIGQTMPFIPHQDQIISPVLAIPSAFSFLMRAEDAILSMELPFLTMQMNL